MASVLQMVLDASPPEQARSILHELYGDPFQAAAGRTRQSVRPEGGRQEGALYPMIVGGLESAREFMGGDPTIAGTVEAAMNALPAGRGRARLGRSDEADALREMMAKYGRDEQTLRQSWQKRGPEVDYIDYVHGRDWQKVVRDWNARGGPQIDANAYRVGSEPAFEAFVKSVHPDKRSDFPGRRQALEWFAENDPL